MWSRFHKFVKNHWEAVGVTIGVSGGIVFLAESEWGRSIRLRYKASKPVKEMDRNFPFVMKTTLETDLHNILTNPDGGVKIIWTPPGGGKTSTTLVVCNELLKNKKIGGLLVFRPPKNGGDFVNGFTQQTSDYFSPLLKPEEALSQLLPKSDKPVVVLIDQIDNAVLNEDAERAIRCMAEDSTLSKSYIVLILTHSAKNAYRMREWNGRQKIVIANNDDPMKYKWDENDVREWIKRYIESSNTDPLRMNDLAKLAVRAGTPGFLYLNAKSVCSGRLESASDRDAESTEKEWQIGRDLINS